uniref:Uncharacterized protein n=1 Tax=Pithovirus LCPAC304 TaxID=2506594 RepID=A0A481Z9T1_9VIRU|nr:MAG: hypothetical protein LCPAC304_04590 [Pithovirus LCPAC304]
MEGALQTEIIAQWEELFASLLKQGRIKDVTEPEKIIDPKTCPIEMQSINNFLRRKKGASPDDAPYSSEYDSSDVSEEPDEFVFDTIHFQ